MSRLLDPIFPRRNYPFQDTVSDYQPDLVCFVIPYALFKKSPQGWRDFQPSGHEAQMAFMTLQLLGQALQNPKIGKPTANGRPSLFFSGITGSGVMQCIPKFRIFVELLVTETKDAQGEEMPLEEISIGDNIVGVRVWVHVLDEQYNVARAIQAQLRENLRQVKPAEYDQLYGKSQDSDSDDEGSGDRGGSVAFTPRSTPALQATDDDPSTGDFMDTGGSPSPSPSSQRQPRAPQPPPRSSAGGKSKKRFRPMRRPPPKTTFAQHELHMRITDTQLYGEFVADAYRDRNEENSGSMDACAEDESLQHPDFQLDQGGEHVHPSQVFSDSRGFEYSRALGVCQEQSTVEHYTVEQGWRFPVPRLVWCYDTKQFAPDTLLRNQFPWTISRFNTIFSRYVRERGLRHVHLGRSMDHTRAGARTERNERKFARLGMTIGAAKHREEMQEVLIVDDMRRITNMMDNRWEQLQEVADYDDEGFLQLYRIFREDALRELQGVLDVSCDISQPLKAMLIWVEEMRWEHFNTEMNTIDLELGRYGHFTANDLLIIETYLLVSHVHRTQHEILLARYDAYRDKKGLHYNICQLGGPGSSKSATTDRMEECSIPGTVRRSDGSSAKAMTTNQSQNDSIELLDEYPETLVGSKRTMNTADKDKTNMMKASMTSGLICYDYLDLVEDSEGKRQRVTRRTRAERIGVVLGSSNALDDGADPAMGTRIRTIPSMPMERRYKHVVGLIAARFSSADKRNEKYTMNFYHKQQWLNALAWKMIQTRYLPAPNIDVGNFESQLMLNFLASHGFPVYSRVRAFERVQIMSMLETVAFAIDVVFNSEISPLIVRDPETGQPRIKDFEYQDMLYLIPLLCQREDCAIKVFTQLVDEYISSQEYAVIKWIMHDQANYDTDLPAEEQTTIDVRWRYDTSSGEYDVQKHNLNYVAIHNMDVRKLATYVAKHLKEFRISEVVVRKMLRGLQERTITTKNYITPFIPDEQKVDCGRPSPIQKTIAVLEESVGPGKGERTVYIATEFIRHNPDELVRLMVTVSLQHQYTRPRTVLLGLTDRRRPYIFQSMRLERDPDRTLSLPSATSVDDTVRAAMFSKTRDDEQAAFALDSDRQQHYHTVSEDIEELFFRRHFRESAVPESEWAEWFPARVDERIREVRGYYSAKRDPSEIRIPHSRGADHRVEGDPQYSSIDACLRYPDQFIQSAMENERMLERRFGNEFSDQLPAPPSQERLSAPANQERLLAPASQERLPALPVPVDTLMLDTLRDRDSVITTPTEELDFLKIDNDGYEEVGYE